MGQISPFNGVKQLKVSAEKGDIWAEFAHDCVLLKNFSRNSK
jgi:hypothetical protein